VSRVNPLPLVDVMSKTVTRGVQGKEAPLENFSPPMEECVGYSLKNLGPWPPGVEAGCKPGNATPTSWRTTDCNTNFDAF